MYLVYAAQRKRNLTNVGVPAWRRSRLTTVELHASWYTLKQKSNRSENTFVAQADSVVAGPNGTDPVAPLWHTTVFILVCAALAVANVWRIQHASGVLPHRMRGYIFSILFEWGLVLYVWWFALRPRGKRMNDLIGGKWTRASNFFRDVGVAFLFWLVVLALQIAARFSLGANPAATRAIKLLAPRTGLETIGWVLVSVTAGITEEFLFRGYLQRQFLALTKSPHAAVALQAIVFGSAHFYQGWKGAVGITLYGVLFGILALMRRSLRPGMMQHAVQDAFSGIAMSLLLRRIHVNDHFLQRLLHDLRHDFAT